MKFSTPEKIGLKHIRFDGSAPPDFSRIVPASTMTDDAFVIATLSGNEFTRGLGRESLWFHKEDKYFLLYLTPEGIYLLHKWNVMYCNIWNEENSGTYEEENVDVSD